MANQKNQNNIPETMEEFMSSIKHGCELARNLEPELVNNMANQPDMLLFSIDEVVRAFNDAKERLVMMISQKQGQTMATTSSSLTPPMLLPHDESQSGQMMGASAHFMDHLFLMQQQPQFGVRGLLENKSGSDVQQYGVTRQIGEMGGKNVEVSDKSKGSEGEMQGIEASPSRPRKSRKNDMEKIMLFPAPQVGNTEMPPDDGFTWRKYGQKEILGTKYPRAYYRCTHQKLYACPAKKQVQRLDDNPNIFQVKYRGEHTCHMSSTAPSSFPPPQLLVDISNSKDMTQTQTNISPQPSPSTTSVSGWLSTVNLGLQGGGGGGGGGAGPSSSKYGTDQYFVADMADAMFNSGSSSGNSMESLFPSTEDKWEAAEKKS
ncbi:hypothetical protein RJT34_11914 [Clitoria ternatea]|uniref:WRKY domain-containing protein n=1 Tax=Clitoria ternatea TaxID=43366 RepID=A0AAN9JLA4_CLITE